MALKTNISWTDATWNVAVGCTKVDEDCKFCYMYRDSRNETRYNPKEVVKTKGVFNTPLKIKEPKKIFTSSLTDFFHEGVDAFRQEAWDIIRKCPQHTFQILTKRPERIREHLPEFWEEIRGRCWLGTSVGSQQGAHRALELIKLREIADVLFLSLQPLHTEVNFRWMYQPPVAQRRKTELDGVPCRVTDQHELLMNIDWVIVGGESGNETGKYRYRPCELSWIEQIVDHCKEAGVPVFVKQMGKHIAKQLGMSGSGENIDEFPEHLRIRQFPKAK